MPKSHPKTLADYDYLGLIEDNKEAIENFRYYKEKAKTAFKKSFSAARTNLHNSHAVTSEAQEFGESAGQGFNQAQTLGKDCQTSNNQGNATRLIPKDTGKEKTWFVRNKQSEFNNGILNPAGFNVVLATTVMSYGYFRKLRPVAATFAASSFFLYGYGMMENSKDHS